MLQHTGRLWRSIVGLPAWVKYWLMVLAGANMASFAFLHTDTGRWAAVAFAIVGAINMPMMFVQGGLTRALSLPHFVWAPLLIHLFPKVVGPGALDHADPEFLLATTLVAVNGISLAFDILESVRWFGGRREILGLATAG